METVVMRYATSKTLSVSSPLIRKTQSTVHNTASPIITTSNMD